MVSLQASDGASFSQKDSMAPSSSSKPAVRLSWVSILKSLVKQVAAPAVVRRLMSGSAASISVNTPVMYSHEVIFLHPEGLLKYMRMILLMKLNIGTPLWFVM